MPSKYSIRDLERLSGIKAHTLRIWEQRYEILNPERTGTNIRCYNNSDLKRILNISLLKNKGFKISTIATFSDNRLLEEVNKFLESYLKESDQIESLVLCLMDMNEERFEKTINNSIIHFGFENTIEKVVFPFLRHIGNMWQLGIVSPAQEHFVSNLIRQKIIVNIDKIGNSLSASGKTIVFFLPQQELHELGLLYTFYLARTQGHKCIYLGQSLPFEDLVTVSRSVKPHALVSVFTTTAPGISLQSLLKGYEDSIADCQFLLSGRLLLEPSGNLKVPSQRFHIFESFQAFKALI